MDYFYTLEARAEINWEDYNRLSAVLSERFKLVRKGNLYVTKFDPGNIRLIHTENLKELIIKEETGCRFLRKIINQKLSNDTVYLRLEKKLLDSGKLQEQPYTLLQREFVCEIDGEVYRIFIQHKADQYQLKVAYNSRKKVIDPYIFIVHKLLHSLVEGQEIAKKNRRIYNI